MSDDPAQDYFADGMTEDLFTDLSRISGLFVIARNSTLTYESGRDSAMCRTAAPSHNRKFRWAWVTYFKTRKKIRLKTIENGVCSTARS